MSINDIFPKATVLSLRRHNQLPVNVTEESLADSYTSPLKIPVSSKPVIFDPVVFNHRSPDPVSNIT